MRRVAQSAVARAAVERLTQQYPSFRRIFESSIIWQLERQPEIAATPIPDTDPVIFVLETGAFRAEGIPTLRIAYVEDDRGIEIVSVARNDD